MKEYTETKRDNDIFDERIFVGDAAEIKAVYNSLWNAELKGSSLIRSAYCQKAKFNASRLYALLISLDDNTGRRRYTVVDANTALHCIITGEWIPA